MDKDHLTYAQEAFANAAQRKSREGWLQLMWLHLLWAVAG